MVVGALLLLAVVAAVGSPVSPTLRTRQTDGHRVVYRIEDRSGDDSVVSAEVVEVRRPYGSRIERREGSRGSIRSGQVTSRRHLWQLEERGRLRFGVLRPPGGPARDASYTVLREASRAGIADAVGSDVVLGHSCSWFAYRGPAPDPLAPPTKDDRVEACVDAAGVVLREVWTIGGRLARVIEAVDLTEQVPKKSRFLEGKDPATQNVAEPEAGELIRTSTLVADVPHGREVLPLRLTPPTGWRADRTAVVATTPGGSSQPIQFLAEAYVRDGHVRGGAGDADGLVVVEISSSPRFAPPWATDEGSRINIGAGEGRLVYFVDHVEIRLLSAIGFARVKAPSRAIAFEFVRGLQPAR